MKEFDVLLDQRASYQCKFPIGEASIHYYARVIGDESPIYTDAQAAMEAGYDGIIAPPTFVCETLMYSERQPDEYGYIGHAWDIEVEGWWRVRGGNRYRFLQPVVPTDILRLQWHVESIRETKDRRGQSIVIVVQVASYFNQHEVLLCENAETVIYRKNEI